MTKKEKLECFSTEQLELIKRIIQTTPDYEIISIINTIKKERREKQQINWNSLYPVDDLVLDYGLVQLLKENKIFTLQDLMNANVTRINGITKQDLIDIEWAKMFFDMTPLQESKVNSESEAVKIIVKQAKETEEYFKK